MSYHHRQHCLLLRMRYCIRPVSFTYKNKMKIHDSLKKLPIPRQKAQTMLTNTRDAFGGQSRSPNVVHFIC